MNINILNLNHNKIYVSNKKTLEFRTFQQKKYLDTTEFLRKDFDIDGILNYAKSFFKNTEKVNIINYACSNGKETYSLLLRLKIMFKEQAKKFLPLVAKDIDKENILKAKIGKYLLSKEEEYKLDKASELKLNRYISIDNDENIAHIKDSLKNDINFSVADINSDISNIPKENVLLVCRNFWNYLDEKNQLELIKKISKILKHTSLIAIGSFDKAYGIDLLLEKEGFIKTSVYGLYEKI